MQDDSIPGRVRIKNSAFTRMLTLWFAPVLFAIAARAEMATVVSRGLEATAIRQNSSKNPILGPFYKATFVFRRDNGSELTWNGTLEGYFPEEALTLYDRYRPGTRIAIPAGDRLERGASQDRSLGLLVVGATLALFVLFFTLPVLYMIGVRNWWTNPARLFVLFGLGALAGAVLSALSTHRQLTRWQAVDAKLERGRPVDLLKSYGAEVKFDEVVAGYFGRRGDPVFTYEVGGQTYRFVVHAGTGIYRDGTPCQPGETCRLVYDPVNPFELAVPRPFSAETFAPALALAGFGLIFTLAGLLVGR